MKNLITAQPAAQTMSSLELVKIINALRELGQAEMQHKHFLVKVPKVLGDELAKFLASQYLAGNGQMQPCYGYQNLYPLRAFNECYPEFDFDDLTPELIDDKKPSWH